MPVIKAHVPFEKERSHATYNEGESEVAESK